MEYPLMIDGVKSGVLRLSREGLYSVFEAELPRVQEGIFRIWIHGGGESSYLGLMQPWSGGMYLRRRLSRREMESFPGSIEYASNTDSLHNCKECADKNTDIKEDASLHNNEKPVESSGPSCPWPAPVTRETEGLLWVRRSDGSLVSHDGVSSLVALPAKLRKEREGAHIRLVEGEEYMVFRY